ncbi:MAG TPA: alkaline phosphatase family protein [Streptosporangiaceae bacterium]|nr:alkaline phosphatase family protein [Streptosporangiaceae bacterium]
MSHSRPKPRPWLPLTRRRFLTAAGGAAAFGALGGPGLLGRAAAGTTPQELPASTSAALHVLGRSTLRLPGSLPAPSVAAGTDTLPGIDHIVVLMLENHSYDNILGMLGRGPGQTPRGDGFTIGTDGLPTATNPYGDGRIQHAFHMPTTCQLPGTPSQQWTASHHAYDGGRNDGFVTAPIYYGSSQTVGGVAMGYWTGNDLPFTYALAETFPIGDRWFSSLLGQTDPNRRYLIAGTSAGMTGDIGTSPGNFIPDAGLPLPANGTIFNTLDRYGITWANYVSSFPTGATPELYPTDDAVTEQAHYKPFSQFYADAAAGTLPSFSLLDPDYGTQSQENPQNIAVGERLLADVVNALGSSPLWHSTLFVLVYDEHGGYFDHVPPPAALAPDAIPPMVEPGESVYDGFSRYGFRVPSVVVSPYAKRNYVSHVYYDHTSILATLERKWNLPALTYRDANANDLTDFIDLDALSMGHPVFRTLPRLPAPGDTPAALACSVNGPGTIPPPGSISG